MERRFAMGLLSAFLTGCMSTPPAPVNPLKGVNEDVVILRQQLMEQRADIERLTAAVEALSSVKKEKPPKKLAVTKLVPPREEGSEYDEEAEGADAAPVKKPVAEVENRVGDSKHENMHYYYRGWQQLSQGHYERAIENLREFLKANPDHVYADRAQFLIADSHFRNKEYGLAVIASNQLESRFPTSVRLPEALYKRGLAYRQMGQEADATRTFRDLIKRFPDDPHADSSHLTP